MIKTIPGNLHYRIDLNGEIYDHRGRVVDYQIYDGALIKIELFGEERLVGHSWLTLLAWYECHYIRNLHEHLGKIKFVDADNSYLRLRCRKMMTFLEPIYYKEGFRYVPGYPRYAINVEGELLDTFTNEMVLRDFVDNHGYPTKYIRTPDKCGNRHVRQHRLVALAWIPHDDFITKPLINHIDGVRRNYARENLEWISPRGNSRHALETGLVSTCAQMKVRDVETGEVTVYYSAAELARTLGMSTGFSSTSCSTKLPGYLWKKRYEIKRGEDQTPWYYESIEPRDFRPSKAIYSITTTNTETGEFKTFINLKHFAQEYKLNLPSLNAKRLVALFKERYKGYEVTCTRNALVGPYTVLNTKSGERCILPTIRAVSAFTGIGHNEIQFDLSRGRRFVYGNQWIVYVGLGDIDTEQYTDKVKIARKILVIDETTGKETTVYSIKQASRLTGVTQRTISANLEKGKVIKGFVFRALDQ